MVLAAIILPMVLLLYFGKNVRELKPRHYAIVALITLLQVSVAVYSMFTMERPPLF
jgi:hypothetical protein